MLVRDVGRIQNIIGRILSDTGRAYFVDAVRRGQAEFLFEYGGVEVEEEQVQHFSRENSGRRWLRMNCSRKQAKDPSYQRCCNFFSLMKNILNILVYDRTLIILTLGIFFLSKFY